MESQRRHLHPQISGIAVCLVVVSGLGGCGFLWDATPNAGPGSGKGTYQAVHSSLRGKVLESTQAPIQLALPRGWQAAPNRTLHNSADLDAYNPGREIYLVVLGEERSQVQFNQLEENAAEYRRLLTRGFAGQPEEARTNLDRVDNFPAVQYEIRGKVGSQAVVYLHTTTEVGTKYYQIVVWTPAERYADNEAAMRRIVEDFQASS